MITFTTQDIKTDSKIKANTETGWVFAFRSNNYDMVCEKWSYTAGIVHNYIYKWHNVSNIWPKRSYIMTATANIKRASDNINIPASQISISLDWNSWCWQISFQLLGRNNLDYIKPQNGQPSELIATINGYSWHFFVERWNEVYSFGSNSFLVQGRGLIAELDEPYYAKKDYFFSSDTSAKQLIEEILQNTGWTLDWQIVDWIIKGGAFSIYATPIRAILRIVQAQDAILFGDANEKKIHIFKRFKVSSWNMAGATPNVSVPEHAVLSLSQEFVPQISYLGCRLQGTTAGGVAALVKRAGTNGAPCFDQITDDLFTDTTLLIERGRTELSKRSGPYYKSNIVIPLTLEEGIGLLNIGDILQFSLDGEAHKGIVTAIKIDATIGEDIKIGQMLEVLRWV